MVTAVWPVAPPLSVAWNVTTMVWFAWAWVGVQVAVMVLLEAGEPNALNVMPVGALRACRPVIVPSVSVAVTLNVSVVLATGWKRPAGLAATVGGWLTATGWVTFRM